MRPDYLTLAFWTEVATVIACFLGVVFALFGSY